MQKPGNGGGVEGRGQAGGGSPESAKTAVWQRISRWLFGSLTIPTVIGFTFSALFIVTDIFGDVTGDDIKAFYTVYTVKQNTGDQLSPLVTLTSTREIRTLKGCQDPSFQMSPISADDIYLSNWFGESMHAVLHVTEKLIGLFYDVHLPTSVQGIAQLVRDPTFGMQHVEMVTGSIPENTVFATFDRLMNTKSCSDAAAELLKRGEYVCALDKIYFERTSNRVVGGHVFRSCLTPPDARYPVEAPQPASSYRTRVKLFLGLLIERSAASP